MLRQTFEESLRTTLANSRLGRIVEGEESTYDWQSSLTKDRKDVENVIDKLCADLTVLTGRSKLC